MKRGLFLLCLYLFSSATLLAQETEEPFLSWQDFIDEYFSDLSDEEESTASRTDLYETFEALHLSPINLNTASREALLNIPLLDEAQVDSIISYRRRKHLFFSRGELMYIRNLSHQTRRYLSLFVYCGEPPKQKVPISKQFYTGKHSLESRLDIPLYQRAGYKEKSKEELIDNPNSVYLGNTLRHQVRYRYQWRQQVAYGFTLEKDAGEPFGKYESYPYDYNSFYFRYSPSEHWDLFVGDYGLRFGHGLLFGRTFFTNRIAAVEQGLRTRAIVKAHTSSNEQDFFRGTAAVYRKKNWEYIVFASYRRLDARIKDGKATSLSAEGYHRTFSEYDLRHRLGNTTFGGRLAYTRSKGHIGLNGFYSLYDKEIAPSVRAYNRFFLRGRNAAGLSVDYQLRTAKWKFSGETAFDKRFHLACSHSATYKFNNRYHIFLQQRSYAHRFVSPFGSSLEQGSRVANELGLTLGGQAQPLRQIKIVSYIDLFRFPDVTYTAAQASNGLEYHLQGEYTRSRRLSFLARYKLKARQYNVSGMSGLLETRQTHRLRLQARWNEAAYSLNLSTDFTAACSQTKAPSLGWMVSGRGSAELPKQWQVSAFGGLFFTDDYASSIYAYEPQLRHSFSFPRFYHHGCRFVAQVGWKGCKHFEAALRYGLLYYFNRSTIGSGLQKIDAPATNDLSIYLRLTL
ncbi:MAG: helix-hairpin-helix domain-containing protein [Bacteroidaceae bacterium]|nr:helix-hairpin-helix domain-containing protein [Bacteroidaceae bacterium]